MFWGVVRGPFHPIYDSLHSASADILLGSLGTAILRGLLSAKTSTVKLDEVLVTVGSKSSAEALSETLRSLPERTKIHVYQGQNVSVAQQSDIVILACPPSVMTEALGESGMQDALRGKLLISVLAGVTTSSIRKTISGGRQSSENECYVVRALPNLAVAQHASATAIEIVPPDLPVDKTEMASAIFKLLGEIVHLPASLMDAATIMCGSTPALIALFLDGLIDGAVAAGVPRSKADVMAAQVLASTAALLQNGQRASTLRESVCAMPGCTIQASIALEQGGVRGTAATAMKAAIEAASKLC